MIQHLTTSQVTSLPPKLRELYDEAKEITMNFNPRLMANKDIADAADTIYQKISPFLDKKKAASPKKTPVKKATTRKKVATKK
ncbi:hypothetical protein, partial [Bernardetia sp.]|uniref:hypothetical protein n=1 Tax=Bernardetia sp. TaxID=1937974 RepID=UPI0025C4CFD0